MNGCIIMPEFMYRQKSCAIANMTAQCALYIWVPWKLWQ